MDISIIIPTYNRKEIFEQTLSCAIEAVAELNAEVIIVNDANGSEVVIPNDQLVSITVVKCIKPGVAAKRNLGQV
ncbi:MAG: glycosyltransferase family A protein [Cyclobacteriaceae bacterium]